MQKIIQQQHYLNILVQLIINFYYIFKRKRRRITINQSEQKTQLPVKFLIIGRTASGKSTIVKNVCNILGLKQVKSLTTRQPRKSELNNPDCDHYFVSDEEFETMINNNYAAYTEINGYKYATTFDELDQSDIYVIDPDGVNYLKNVCGNRYKFVEVYIRVPYVLAKNRYMERGGSGTEFKSRYDKESNQFKEYENSQSFDYHILNDGTLEDSIKNLCNIIEKEINM